MQSLSIKAKKKKGKFIPQNLLKKRWRRPIAKTGKIIPKFFEMGVGGFSKSSYKMGGREKKFPRSLRGGSKNRLTSEWGEKGGGYVESLLGAVLAREREVACLSLRKKER